MPVALTPRGTGRPDHTDEVYVMLEPTTYFWQRYSIAIVRVSNVQPGDYCEFRLLPTFEMIKGNLVYETVLPENRTHFVSNVILTSDSNSRIGLDVYWGKPNGLPPLFTKTGFQKVEINVGVTIPLDEMYVRVYNDGDVPINVSYMHHGYYSTVAEIEERVVK